MSRDVDTDKTVYMEHDEVASMLSGADKDTRTYLRQRPWMLDEYRRRGFGDEVDKIIEDLPEPEVDPNEVDRVTTEGMSLGRQPRTKQHALPNGVVPPEVDDADEADEPYEKWTVEDLKSEIDDRNEGREGDDKLSKTGTKQELVDRLYADDGEA